jgi:hypothetical protein
MIQWVVYLTTEDAPAGGLFGARPDPEVAITNAIERALADWDGQVDRIDRV